MRVETAEPETNEALRRCVRDLVALSTLPAIWSNARRPQIAESLAEILTRSLALDLAYVQVRNAFDPDVEAAHDRPGPPGGGGGRGGRRMRWDRIWPRRGSTRSTSCRTRPARAASVWWRCRSDTR